MPVSVFFRKSIPLLGVIIFTSLCGIGGIAHAQNVKRNFSDNASQRLQRSRPRMKVIEIAPAESKSKSYFTVVGAVGRSGVYHSDESRIQLHQLLKAAGGSSGVDNSSIRIVRNGQSGLQLYYLKDQQLNQEIQSGDIIVVVPAPDQSFIQYQENQFIPVACIGLDERPVVIPFSIGVRSVDAVLLSLRQPKSLKQSVNVLDPLGDSRSNRLLPGTVLFFNPRELDRSALASLSEFPPAVSLKDSLLKADSSAQVQPLQKELLANDKPEIIPHSNVPPALTAKEFDHLAETDDQQSVEPSGDTPPPLLVNPQKSVITVEEPETKLAQLPKEANTSETQPVSSRLEHSPAFALMMKNTDIDLLSEENDSKATEQGQSQIEGVNDPSVPRQSSPIRESDEIAPPPPMETRILRKFEQLPKRRPAVAVIEKKVSKPVTDLPRVGASKPAENSQSQVVIIVSVLACVAVFCLIISILLSRRERHKLREEKALRNAKQQAETIVGQHITTPDEISQVLDRSTPIIEEDVLLPVEIMIHGEPVAQRRIIFHSHEEKLRGPHFNKQSQSKNKLTSSSKFEAVITANSIENDSDRDLSAFNHDTVEPDLDIVQIPEEGNRGKEDFTNVPQSLLDTEGNNRQRVDVVIPDSSDAHPEIEETANSPLERALRILAREKNS